MCYPHGDEINAILKAEADLKAAREVLVKAEATLASIPKITAPIQLPKDWHDDRPAGWTEDDRNSGCAPSQILGR